MQNNTKKNYSKKIRKFTTVIIKAKYVINYNMTLQFNLVLGIKQIIKQYYGRKLRIYSNDDEEALFVIAEFPNLHEAYYAFLQMRDELQISFSFTPVRRLKVEIMSTE
jgi:hypothetical protein